MQVDNNNNNNNKRKIPTSAEIVDVPPSGSPSIISSEISFKPENDDSVSAGATKLSKEETQLFFKVEI